VDANCGASLSKRVVHRPPRRRLGARRAAIGGGKQLFMADVTAGQGAESPGFGFSPSLSDIGTLLKRGDLALGVRHPHHPGGADPPSAPRSCSTCSWRSSIILSILILMTALFIQAPLEFSSFPTVPVDRDHAAAVRSTSLRRG